MKIYEGENVGKKREKKNSERQATCVMQTRHLQVGGLGVTAFKRMHNHI